MLDYYDPNHGNGLATEIALIAPTIELTKKTKKIIDERNEKINVFTSMVEVDAISDALRIARKIVEEGTKIIITRKGTAIAIRNAKLDVSVVVINTILSDYVESIKVAKQYNGLIAFFSYDKMTDDVKSVCSMLDMKAKFYNFKSDKDCEKIVKQAIKDGAVLGIGGVMSQKYSDIYNLNHITIENSEVSIVNAIENARQLLLVKKEELNKQNELKLQLERYKAVLNFTHDAIIAVDETGTIDVINPVAEDIVKVASGYAIGKNIKEIISNSEMLYPRKLKEKQLNQLMDINGTLVSTNRVPIIVENQIKGVVATFQDIKIIQENENKIRRTLYKKGLVAKYNFRDIKGKSEALKNTIEIARSFGLSDSTILIQGETGTGKELFAQSIHNISKRKDGPFVAINCAALSKSLLESELFGYEEGAFTGASKGGKIGLFELAHKGTIFLDEIGEIPTEIQAQLLRVLQEKEIRKVGSGVKTPVDVRVVAATNRDLKAEILSKSFREDLYYRICVLNLHIPPLRERDDDIKLLSRFFFDKYLGSNSKKYLERFNIIMDKVQDYKWHGNIRELQNFVERISVLLHYQGNNKDTEELIDELLRNKGMYNSSHDNINEIDNYNVNDEEVNLEQWEINRIIKALKDNNLSMQKAADDLGISRTTLWRKMKLYKINYK
ncbi:sigma 54-interacting transcriptional regulator [Tissierella praeacuta]|uniref:sigma 54-interacting transcriptional regulator n=1 Tax=Tissierella praeacuta TaxID=43131 RepID=UPI0033410254